MSVETALGHPSGSELFTCAARIDATFRLGNEYQSRGYLVRFLSEMMVLRSVEMEGQRT